MMSDDLFFLILLALVNLGALAAICFFYLDSGWRRPRNYRFLVQGLALVATPILFASVVRRYMMELANRTGNEAGAFGALTLVLPFVALSLAVLYAVGSTLPRSSRHQHLLRNRMTAAAALAWLVLLSFWVSYR
jgi:uncharacterized membrane protein YjjP (DUF1212 family)